MTCWQMNEGQEKQAVQQTARHCWIKCKLTQEKNGCGLSIDVYHGPQWPADIHSWEKLLLFCCSVVDWDVYISSRRHPELQLRTFLTVGFMHGSGPVAGCVIEVGDGQGGQRQRSGFRRHVGEAHSQSPVPVTSTLLHPHTNPLFRLHRAAAEHQTVLEGASHPLCESTALTQCDLVSNNQTVEGQVAEAAPSTSVWLPGLNNCNGTKPQI